LPSETNRPLTSEPILLKEEVKNLEKALKILQFLINPSDLMEKRAFSTGIKSWQNSSN